MPAVSLAAQAEADPNYSRFSDAHLAVASNWADLLELSGVRKSRFITHYLERTATSRYWCVALPPTRDGKPRALARMGNILQRFDGTTITAIAANPKQLLRAELLRSSGHFQIGLMLLSAKSQKVMPLLTSYCKEAHSRALDAAHLDVSADAGYAKNAPKMSAIRAKYHIKQYGAVIRAFCSHLDPEVLFTTRSVACPAADLYNWLSNGDRTRRLQAVRAQRILVPLSICTAQSIPSVVLDTAPWLELRAMAERQKVSTDQVLGVISDAGLSLNEALAWLLNSKPSDVRAVGRVAPYHAGSALSQIERCGPESSWVCLLDGASLGNRIPRSKKAWRMFLMVWLALPSGARASGCKLAVLLRGTPLDWEDPAWYDIIATLQDSGELFQHLDLVAGDALWRIEQFYSRCNYRQLANLVAGMHRALDAFRATELEQEADLPRERPTHWVGMLQGTSRVTAPNGCDIVELLCAGDLNAEHDALDHCIDTYDGLAMQGVCRLFSIRRGDTSLASAEIRLAKADRSRVTVQQLRGTMNKPVTEDSPAGVAFAWFMQEVQARHIDVTLPWPMQRLGGTERQSRLSQAIAHWVLNQVHLP